MNRKTFAALLISLAGASCATSTPVLADANHGLGVRTAPALSRTAGADPLEIDAYPRILTAGDHLSVRLRVEPNVLSRSVDLSWWSADGLGGSHLMQVDGDRAAIRYEFPIKRIDAGEYEITAVLTRGDGTRVRRSTTVLVVSRGF